MDRLQNIGLKSISTNTISQFFLRIATSIPTFIATILIAYYGGFVVLGSFTKIIAFVSIFYFFVDFGMNSIFLKLHFGASQKNLGNLLLLRVLVAIILIPVISILSNILPYNELAGTGFSDFEKFGMVIYSFTLVTFGLVLSLQAYLQEKLSYSLTFVPSLLSSLVLLIIIVIASASQNLPLLLLSYIISGGIMFASLFFIIQKKYSLKLETQDFSKFSYALIVYSLPMGAMLFFNMLYARVDALILSFYRPTVEVGIYGVSYRFFELAIAVAAFMSNSVYPLLLKKREDKKEFIELLKKYLFLFFLISLLLMIVALIFSPLLKFINSDFEKSILPLQILVISLPFFFMTSLLQWYFLIKEKMELLIPVYFFAFLLNIFLNIIFIPKFSYLAASSTTLFSEAVVFIILMWYFRKSRLD